MIVRGRLAKWCLLCRSQCWAIPYIKLFGSEFNASENKIVSSTSFALCFAKWAYYSVWFPCALFLLLLILPIHFPLILLSCSSYLVFLCPMGMGLFNRWLTGMGTLRNYLLSSLVESWSPDKLWVFPGNTVEMNLEKSPNSFTCLQVCHTCNRPGGSYLGQLFYQVFRSLAHNTHFPPYT